MKDLIQNDNPIIFSFKQLLNIQKEKYLKETITKNKEYIASKLICDPDISKDLLNYFTDLIKKESKKSSPFIDAFEHYYHILQYSLPTNDNLKFYNILKAINPERISELSSYEYLAFNDPINNFKTLYLKYSGLIKDIFVSLNSFDSDKVKKHLQDINSYIDKMLKVYDINLGSFYCPPMKEYPTYAYNYYSYLFFQTLKKFRKERIKQPFKNNNITNTKYTEKDLIFINYSIGLFFKEVNNLFEKFNYKNIDKDIRILKIIIYYFESFEYSRDFFSSGLNFQKIIKCLNSEAITSDILNTFTFYRRNSETPIQKEEWDNIKINETVYIKYPFELAVKIKYFNKDILKLDYMHLVYALNGYSIENLNIDGIINNSIIKFSPEIEQYSKELLKSILSSEIYIKNYLKYNKRFNSHKMESLLRNIFKGSNINLILDEIWENVFFIPFLDKNNTDFIYKEQYSIFINSNPEFVFETTFQKIIPYFHYQINNLWHKFTQNIDLLLTANLEYNQFETMDINDKNELEELIDIQKKYFLKYHQNNKIYTIFEDFGDTMKVELFRKRPRIFKTLSGLFCLDSASYDLNSNDFKEIYVYLFNFDIENNNSKNSKDNIGKYNIDVLLNQLMNSKIAQLLKYYFNVEIGLKNESYTDYGKPIGNSLYNEEISINIDYCDKLG